MGQELLISFSSSIDFVIGRWYCLDIGCIADVSEILTAFIFSISSSSSFKPAVLM
jgi:hypothetical protein